MTQTNAETILIVDDNLTNLGVLFAHLRSVGFKVLVAENGRSAINRARLALPDIILLDILMPGMDGFETCHRLKEDPLTRDIPVILMTALTDTENKVKGFSTGAVDYITKPAQYEEVTARINTHLTIRKLQNNLEMRLKEREKLIAELDAYAQTVAHDLKAPLALILGFAEVLQSGYSTIPQEKVDQLLGSILRNGRKMQDIIEGLLLLANVRQEEIELAPLMMAPMLAEAQARLALMIADHQADIEINGPLPEVQGYIPWLEEIWVNLLSNAIKYGGQPPHIEISAQTQAPGMACFFIHDNGRGLSPEEQQKLFIPFSRLAADSQVEGHGLGLSIVERIVTKLGGTVGVESHPGRGSTFYFTLPLAGQEAAVVGETAVP